MTEPPPSDRPGEALSARENGLDPSDPTRNIGHEPTGEREKGAAAAFPSSFEGLVAVRVRRLNGS